MKRAISWACLILLAAGLCSAQRSDQKLSVIWSAEPDCDRANTDAVKALRPQCRSVEIENMTFRIIDVGGISYAMTHRPVRDFLVASVQISNKATSPIELVTKRSRLGRYKSAQEYAANAKPEFGNAQSQDELRKAVYRENELIGEKDGGIRTGLQKRDKFEESSGGGRMIRRPGSNIDEPAPPPTERPADSMITSALLVPRAIFDFVLKSKTIPAGEKAAGHLVFKNDSEDKAYLVMYLNAGQIEFVFPTSPK